MQSRLWQEAAFRSTRLCADGWKASGSGKLDPILIQVGPIVLRSYATLVYTGLLTGGVLVALEIRRRRIPGLPIVDAALAAWAAGILLGRAWYVAMNWAYYASHFAEAMRLWDGGFAWHGVVIGGVIGAAAAARRRRVAVAQVLDVLTPGAAAVATFGWLACQEVGCAWGIETYPGQRLVWAMSRDLPDIYGIREPRVAVQLLSAGWSALLLGGVLIAGRKVRKQGVVFALWLAFQSLGSFGLGFWRGDQVAMIMDWRIDQVMNVLLTSGGLTIALASLLGRKGKRVSGREGRQPIGGKANGEQ